ncbi:hypothetical protein F8O07_06675 [Pseudoclavibacter sp. CFCC 13796]|uniref:hypothetical protein n=1 Tax=Pseudoclavibacter sp. CFCC 13796 TaxID=2615179 RepID=UPI0013010A7E|nr:hypothetical protein [Pseudoclavibacter sp. CFCC 13796]KAB1661583.1 hypothetical protein F8O07_06675 [Pseudoclavibacter sp. CFCC 13796]
MLRATTHGASRGLGRPQSWVLTGEELIPVWDDEHFIGPADSPKGETVDELAAALEQQQAHVQHRTEMENRA